MAKVNGPLMSLKATGTFGKTITYQGRPSGTAAFVPVTPYDPKSTIQLAIREYISNGVAYWQNLSPVYQAQWNSFIN